MLKRFLALVLLACSGCAQRHFDWSLSWELQSAPSGPNAPWRVFYWIERNRSVIAQVSSTRRISSRALAGIVAYEALVDVQSPIIQNIARYAGPGKVHYRQTYLPFEGETVARTIEILGYLPRRSAADRAGILATDRGAIEYIGAIMGAFADVSERHHRNIRCRADLLATMYSAWALDDFDKHLNDKKGALRANDVGEWVKRQHSYLARAVGKDSLCPA